MCLAKYDGGGGYDDVSMESALTESPFYLHQASRENPELGTFSSTSPVRYQILEGSSIFKRDKLYDSLGYSYSFHRRTNASEHWRCYSKLKECGRCGVTIRITNEGEYIRDKKPHNHQPQNRFPNTLKWWNYCNKKSLKSENRPFALRKGAFLMYLEKNKTTIWDIFYFMGVLWGSPSVCQEGFF